MNGDSKIPGMRVNNRMADVSRCILAERRVISASIMTTNGVCPSMTIESCSRCCCWRARKPGLSWETILNKRENYREAFDNFDAERDRPL